MNPIVLIAAAAGGWFLYTNHKKAQGTPYTGGRPSGRWCLGKARAEGAKERAKERPTPA